MVTNLGYRFYAHNLHRFYTCDWVLGWNRPTPASAQPPAPAPPPVEAEAIVPLTISGAPLR
jgi:hypothetical protein